ncbi:MAG: gliding motility-associated C-terminal domain-containing protein [Bacteroidota bacterium]
MMHSSRNITGVIALLLLASIKPAFAQNLVRNCQLEETLGCPSSNGQLSYCKYWYEPGDGTSDFFHSCNTGNYSVPFNNFGFQNARSGEAYVNLISYYPRNGQYREYMQTKLACTMQAGKAYYVSFYVSLADKSRYAIDAIGAYFSTTKIEQNDDNLIDIVGDVHISNTAGQVIKDMVNWKIIQGTYIAQGGEKYITIGNFLANDEVVSDEFTSWEKELASYYIDDISVFPVEPIIELGNDTTICPNDSILFDFSDVCAYAGLIWEDGSDDLLRWVSEAKTYSLSGTIGCTQFYDDITISHSPDPGHFLPADTVICPNKIIDIIPNDNFSSYAWQDGSDQPSYSATSEGLYWLDVVNTYGCSFSDTVLISGLTEPNFRLGNDTLFCLGEETTLDPGIDSAFHHFLWSDNSTGTILTVSDSGEYWLQVINPCGEMTDNIFIHTYNCKPAIAAPNAFTPNGDGKNDEFTLKAENISNFKMYIYDRWGTMVFETSDISRGWDGSHLGSTAPTGTYVWLAVYDIRLDDHSYQTKKIKGTVVLIH